MQIQNTEQTSINYVSELRNIIIYLRQHKLISKTAKLLNTTAQTLYNWMELQNTSQSLAYSALLRLTTIDTDKHDDLKAPKLFAMLALKMETRK